MAIKDIVIQLTFCHIFVSSDFRYERSHNKFNSTAIFADTVKIFYSRLYWHKMFSCSQAYKHKRYTLVHITSNVIIAKRTFINDVRKKFNIFDHTCIPCPRIFYTCNMACPLWHYHPSLPWTSFMDSFPNSILF